MPDIEDDKDGAFALARIPGRFYVSKSFHYAAADESDPLRGRVSRFAYTVSDGAAEVAFERDGGWELVLRETPTRQQLKAIFFEDTRETPTLTFQRFASDGRRIERESFTLHDDEVERLRDFLALIQSRGLVLDEAVRDDRLRFTPEFVRQILGGEHALASVLRENPDVLTAFIRSEIQAPDIIALARRREELQTFERLLRDDAFFDARRADERGPEHVWQAFIEANPWVIGTSLTPQFLHSFSPRKLEQTVRGASLAGPGKRADAVLRTAGALSALVLAEIKHHRTLLVEEEYRTGAWRVSDEVAGGVSQCQYTVDEAQREFGRTLPTTDAAGYVESETFVCRPRSILVVGSLAEFINADGNVHHAKFESFERFRRSLRDPEILTFDELFERARLVVELADAEAGRGT